MANDEHDERTGAIRGAAGEAAGFSQPDAASEAAGLPQPGAAGEAAGLPQPGAAGEAASCSQSGAAGEAASRLHPGAAGEAIADASASATLHGAGPASVTPMRDADVPVLPHPRMPLSQRAKIFIPFDPLKGYQEALREKEREAEARMNERIHIDDPA